MVKHWRQVYHYPQAWLLVSKLCFVSVGWLAGNGSKDSSGCCVPVGDIRARPYYYAYADRQNPGDSMNQLVNENMRASLLLIIQTGASV